MRYNYLMSDKNNEALISSPTQNKPKRFPLFSLLIIIGLGIFYTLPIHRFSIKGETMGTTYTVNIISTRFIRLTKLKKDINMRLREINKSMSTFDPQSEISILNASTSTKDIKVSSDLYDVLLLSKLIYKLSDGEWDPTIKPLINLWGFGNSDHDRAIPSEKAIKDTLGMINFKNIQISSATSIRKADFLATLDLSSIAKGYAVDEVALLLKNRKIMKFVVEIGGEIYTYGQRNRKNLWRIGINAPDPSKKDSIQAIIPLKNRAVATSGDYRNFFNSGGHRFSHILSPKTGRPVNNGIVSVSIIAPTCALADGLATATMVMGIEKSLTLIEKIKDVECLILINKDGAIQSVKSSQFPNSISN
jgi:FAD:protein FMN transferase